MNEFNIGTVVKLNNGQNAMIINENVSNDKFIAVLLTEEYINDNVIGINYSDIQSVDNEFLQLLEEKIIKKTKESLMERSFENELTMNLNNIEDNNENVMKR